MNPTLKRTIYWALFIIVIGLIVWGMIVAASKAPTASGPAGAAVPGLPLNTPVTSSDWATGSTSAPVTIVEYADFECPSCQSYAPVVTQLVAEEGSKLNFVYRYFPLPQHPNAVIAASAAEAAGNQGKFWQMHDLLYAKYADWEDLNDDHQIFSGYAAQLGLNVPQFMKDLDSDAVHAKITASYDDAEKNKLDYTPTFFMNGVLISNPQSYADFKALVDSTASSTR